MNERPVEPAVDPELILRPWAITDATALRAAIDEDVGHLKPWLSWTLEEPATLEQTGLRLDAWIDQFRNATSQRYAITSVESPATILGGANLSSRFGPDVFDLGYWVRRSAAGRGIARAAVAALIVEAFDRRAAGRLVIQCDVGNARSAGFARALGFDFVGTTNRPFDDGTDRPVLEFEMMPAAYRDRHAEIFREQARKVRLQT